MKRLEFLKGVGIAGIGALLPICKAGAAVNGLQKTTLSCTLIPQETDGPYPLDLSSNSSMFRQDITEGNAGTPLNLTLTFVNINDNCSPIQNARVDIWHCNKDGYYSGYANQPGYLGTQSYVGATFFRGIQLTDNNGQVTFTTIYPGWYTGRVTHIHFQVFLNSVLKATSQLAFPDSLNTTVYGTSLYSAHGQNTSVTSNSADNVFSDMNNTQYELLSVTANSTTGGYDASLIVGVDVPVTGIINLQTQTGNQFVLEQNFPNPFTNSTQIKFSLANTSAVTMDVFDVTGRKLGRVLQDNLQSGDHVVDLSNNSAGLSLSSGTYIYEISVENSNGHYRQAKVMVVQ